MSSLKILAVETSTEACSVALLVNGEKSFKYKLAPRQHTHLILPMIRELLANAELSLAQLSGFAISGGPGGFTGVRLSAGVVQGLAFAVDLPVSIVSTLAVLAQGGCREFGANNILVALDARMKQIYWGAYQADQWGLVDSIIEDSVSFPEQASIPDGKSDWIGVGSGWKAYENEMQLMSNEKILNIYSDLLPHAMDVLTLAERKYAENDVVSADKAIPIYLRENIY